MKSIWMSYITPLLSPFKMAIAVREAEEQGSGTFVLNEKPYQFLHLAESVACAWPFAIMHAIYSILSIRLGIAFVNQMQHLYDDTFLSGFISFEIFEFKRWIILSVILGTVFFPLSAWVFVKFWKMITLFSLELFTVNIPDKGRTERVERMVASTLTSNLFLIIPIVGTLLKRISFFFIFFAGLRNNLGLSKVQSFVILMAPFLIFGFLLTFFGLTLGVYLNII